MKIITHSSINAPEAHTWIAAYYDKREGGAKGEERLPMVFFGKTEEEAIAKAEQWIIDEQAREAAAAEESARKSEMMAARYANKTPKKRED